MQDPSSNNFEGESPYAYVGNNPVRNIDIGGHFKFPQDKLSEYQTNYGKFVAYIQNGIQQLLQSDRVVKAFAKWGSLKTLKELREEFSYGTGPTIRIDKNMDGTVRGQNLLLNDSPEKSEILLNGNLVDILQRANQSDEGAALLAVIITLLHEEAHHGNLLHKGDENPNSAEDGYSLENSIWGAFIGNADFMAKLGKANSYKSIIKGAKKIIEENLKSGDKKNLPDPSWRDVNFWLSRAFQINPELLRIIRFI